MDLIEHATSLAIEIHAGQVRDHGQPYITHPASVVQYLRSWGVIDPVWISAAWLHDAWEDGADHAQIEKDIRQLHPDVWTLVQGLTKPWHVDPIHPVDVPLYFAMIRQDRALTWIKIADRLSNLDDLHGTSPAKQARYRQETQRDFVDVPWMWMRPWQRDLVIRKLALPSEPI